MANLSLMTRQISPVANGSSVLNSIGIDCSAWLGLSVAERTNRILMSYYPGRAISSLTKTDVLRIQNLLHAADIRCISDGGMLLAAINTTCGDWFSLNTAEKTRRLLVAFWAPLHPEKGIHIVWTQAEQARLQAMINSINSYCISQHAIPPVASSPAGQILVPFAINGYSYSVPSGYPFSASYWLSKTGLSCTGWSSLGAYGKLNAANLALSYAGQFISPSVAASLVRDIDNYCYGASISSIFLSPYAYPYYPYGYGYTIPFAFPFITRNLVFGGFGGFGGFRGGNFGGGHGGGGGGKGGK